MMIPQYDLKILRMLANGKSRPEIAEALGFQKQYKVDARIQEMMEALECNNAAHLVATAFRKGWLT